MKKDNVFKFISIRAPLEVEPDSPRFIKYPEDDSFSNLIDDKISQENIGLKEARIAVAKEYMLSDQYFTQNSGWQLFLRIQRYVIQYVAAKKGKTVKNLKRDFVTFFKGCIDDSFHIFEFLSSNGYRTVKRQLWNSLYSNVIVPDERPQDRDIIHFWIRFFHFLETVDDDNQTRFIADNFNKLRPSVPKAYLLGEEAFFEDLSKNADGINQAQEAQRQEAIAVLEHAIESMHTLRNTIEQVFRKKLISSPLNDSNAGEVVTTLGQGMVRYSSALEMKDSPWRLTVEELNLNEEQKEILLANNVQLELSSAPTVIAQLESCIAVKQSELHTLQTREAVLFSSGTLVRIRQTLI